MLLASCARRRLRFLFQQRFLHGRNMESPKTGEKRILNPPYLTPSIDKKRRSHSPEVPPNNLAANKVDSDSIVAKKQNAQQSHRKQNKRAKKRRKKLVDIEPCSHDDVYWHEVTTLLGRDVVDAAIEEDKDLEAPFEFREELELEIIRLSSNGEGLAIAPFPKRPWVVAVPFSLPGERIQARIYRNARLYSHADFLGIVRPCPTMRDMSRVRCKYFEKCGGCQYQMLSYESQLELKRDVVVRAYETFSGIPAESVPVVLPTAPSPLQYGYRTKITPHFDVPIKTSRRQKGKSPTCPEALPEVTTVPIGFNKVGTREVLDIEECPIATPTINDALGPLRSSIFEKLHTYKRGVSLLLRDSLPIPPPSPEHARDISSEEEHICVTDHRGTVREKVGDMLFDFNANSFFQNNNSVLPSLVEYVRGAIFPPSSDPELGQESNTSTTAVESDARSNSPTHLVDAYCGAGLFSIMLSPYFKTIAGIELSSDSIAAATHNAELNNLPPGRVTFRTGDAAHIFAAVPDFRPGKTAVIVDPPRKGCDENFLVQLLSFRSATIVYVSCNVHTQARDVGMLLRKSSEQLEKGEKTGKYVLESVRGFDLFPQTAHVESVAVLRLV